MTDIDLEERALFAALDERLADARPDLGRITDGAVVAGTGIRRRRQVTTGLATAACVGLLAAGGYVAVEALGTQQTPVSPPVAAAGDDWQTIEYDGVTVEVPDDWGRQDCDVTFGPDGGACDDAGVGFYDRATFDPEAAASNSRKSVESWQPGEIINDSADSGNWGGYVYAGNYAVVVAHADRTMVQRILDSVEAP